MHWNSEVDMSSDVEILEKLKTAKSKIDEEIGKIIVGQKSIIDGLIISLLSRGHCLLPGIM